MTRKMKKIILTSALAAGVAASISGVYAAETRETGKWMQDETGWWWAYDDTTYAVNTWENINGIYYHFDNTGYMDASEYVNGSWVSADGAQLYPYPGSWQQDSTGWWFGDTSGWYARDQWLTINNLSYHFDAAGYMDYDPAGYLNFSNADYTALATALFGEAGTNTEGQLAVGTVILNRLHNSKWKNYRYSDTITGILSYPSQFTGYSLRGDLRSHPERIPQSCWDTAKELLNGRRNETLRAADCSAFSAYSRGFAAAHPRGMNIGGNWFWW